MIAVGVILIVAGVLLWWLTKAKKVVSTEGTRERSLIREIVHQQAMEYFTPKDLKGIQKKAEIFNRPLTDEMVTAEYIARVSREQQAIIALGGIKGRAEASRLLTAENLARLKLQGKDITDETIKQAEYEGLSVPALQAMINIHLAKIYQSRSPEWVEDYQKAVQVAAEEGKPFSSSIFQQERDAEHREKMKAASAEFFATRRTGESYYDWQKKVYGKVKYH